MDEEVDDTWRDYDNDNDDAGNNTSSTTSDEGDNHILSCGRGQGNNIILSFTTVSKSIDFFLRDLLLFFCTWYT